MGVSEHTISRYENNLRFPREKFIELACEILECEVWQLFHKDPLHAQHAIVSWGRHIDRMQGGSQS